MDTLSANNIPRHNAKDSLITSSEFELNGIPHRIEMYSSDFYAPIDGGEVRYELDKLGIIYARSTVWPAYYRLRSNYDSINRIVDAALEKIILTPSLHCYGCFPIQNEVHFKEPYIK